MAGQNLYGRFRCSTGDAMGMNMVSKGAQNVLAYLKDIFHDMDVINLSGNCFADKKVTTMNWIEGRSKSVVCKAVIQEEVVVKVLKTSVSSLLELNTINNLAGSAMDGVIGSFNARATGIISTISIVIGQDPTQNVESSQCMTMMLGQSEEVLVKLASQAAGLNMLGVKGLDQNSPGSNSRCLANIMAASILAAELSVMPSLAAHDLSAVGVLHIPLRVCSINWASEKDKGLSWQQKCVDTRKLIVVAQLYRLSVVWNEVEGPGSHVA
eukprot:Gb_12640 [translate_table: standard]